MQVRPGVSHCLGFTLLEMMLAVGLIALTATFVGLNLGQSDRKLAGLEAKRFIALLNMAVDESIITGRPLRLSIDRAARSYKFTPLAVPDVFASSRTEDSDNEFLEQAPTSGGGGPEKDGLYRKRKIPEVVDMEFSLLPNIFEPEADSRFVSASIHEMMQKDLFDREDDVFEDDDFEDSILIEPNGLISPFELSLSVGEHVSNIGLDRFGRAALLDPQ